MSYVDEVIRHNILFSEYADSLSATLSSVTKDTLDDCKEECRNRDVSTKKKCADAVKAVAVILLEYRSRIDGIMAEFMDGIDETEREWLSDTLAAGLGITLAIPQGIMSVIKDYPFAQAGTPSGLAKKYSEKISGICTDIIQASYTTGAYLEDVMDEASSRFSSVMNGISSDSYTIGENAGNVYDRVVYTKNEKKIKGYVWSAILDKSTCLACGELDGKKFDDISKIPLYPVHNRDRCTLIPYTESIEGMLPESYAEWFEGQDDDVKRAILGKTRYELYKNGMKITDFASKGRIFTLKNLISSKK